MSARPKLAALILGCALLSPALAGAKVVFTGYGDFRFNAYTPYQITGDPAALAPLSVTDTSPHHVRSFTFNDLGLFAATSINDNMDFKVDFDYRQIGAQDAQIRIQYAYFEHRLEDDWSYRVGKLLLPFGYYNQNRFYSFQRVELSAPEFQAAILGLPIADVGVAAQKQLPTDSVRWVFDAYAVNGYGAQAGSPNQFRSPTVLGGLTIANNFAAADNNANVAFGARVTAANLGGKDMEAGLSYYGGAWDPSGSKWFQMYDAHWHSLTGPLDVLLELQHFDTSGDPGFQQVVGDTHWETSGYFTELSWTGLSAFKRPLTPYVGAEGYVSRGHNGQGSEEKLQFYRGGAQYKLNENLALKGEYAYLHYHLPVFNAGEVFLWAHEVQFALVLTF